MAIQVRRGNEADFDASKMLPGEWAVSLDTKYVRICLAPGLVLRMATYESFEADRAQIQAILAECEDIQTAIERIQGEVNSNAALTVESANSAKESADRAHGEAERALSEADRAHSEADKAHSEAERAKSYMDGAESVIGVKLADLYQTKAGAIIEKASGESPLCIRDTADNLVRNLKLYGNTEQDGTSGAQLIDFTLESATVNGITVTYNGDGTYALNGTATAQTVFRIDQSTWGGTDKLKGYDGTYTLSLDGNTDSKVFAVVTQADTWAQYLNTSSLSKSTNTFTAENCYVGIVVASGATLSNYVVKPMLNAGSTPLPWEPYTGGQASPNPDYPQEIRSVKGKNLLENTAGSGTVNGVTFTVNDDGTVTVNGTATGTAYIDINDKVKLKKDEYILSGCLADGSASKYKVDLITSATVLAIDWGSGSPKFTPDPEVTYTARIVVYSGQTFNNAIFKPMIRRASIADDTYVPYGCLRVKAHGKNLWNSDSAFEFTATDTYKVITLSGWRFEAGTMKYLCNVHGFTHGRLVLWAYDASGAMVINTPMPFTRALTQEQADSITTVRLVIEGVTAGTKYSGNFEIMATLDTEATEVEPYAENSITLSQPIELNGIGERDTVTADGISYRYVKKIFDGTENWTQFGTFTGAFQLSVVSDYVSTGYDVVPDLKCTRFIPMSRRDVFDNAKTAITQSNALIVARDNDCAAVGDFKTKLAEWYAAGEPMEVIYKVATPITEPLPTVDQIALRSQLSYDGVTYLEVDCEVVPTIEAECVLDTKRYIDRKFAELATALV